MSGRACRTSRNTLSPSAGAGRSQAKLVQPPVTTGSPPFEASLPAPHYATRLDRSALSRPLTGFLALFVLCFLVELDPAAGYTPESRTPAFIRSACLVPLDSLHPAADQGGSAPVTKASEEDLSRPMSEDEIRLLIRSLELTELDRNKGRAMRWFHEGETGLLPKARLGVLLQDTTLLLAELHTREVLDRVGRDRQIDPKLRKAMEGRFQSALKAFDECAQRQFAGRGGQTALANSRKIVGSFRSALDRLILMAFGPLTQPPPFEWLRNDSRP